MAPAPPDRRARRARQIRRRRAGALAVAVVAAVLVIGAVGLFAGWFAPSNLRTTTAGTHTTAPVVPPTPVPAPVVSSASWPTFGNAPTNTRAAATVDAHLPLHTLWTTNTRRLIELPPVIGGGRVVVGNYGYGVAIDQQTGRILWRHAVGANIAASPALTGLPGTPSAAEPQRDIFATMAGHVLALDPATGRPIWTVALGSSVETSPLVLGDGIFVGTRAGDVVRISLATHRIVWDDQTGGSVKGAISQDGNNIVFGNYAGAVTALNPATGAVVWRVYSPSGSGTFYGAAAVTEGRVFIGNTNGSVIALNASNGRTIWTQQTGGYVYSSPAVADGLVFIGSYDHNLYALSAATGRVVWRQDLGAPISGSPSVIGGLVWIATLGATAASGHTYAINVHSGAIALTRAAGRYAAAVAIPGLIIDPGLDAVTALAPATPAG
jgi:outer membrane protein assembly factor BamB